MTADGAVQGKLDATGQMREFLGIPYAAPPVGDLRWRPPQPAAPWASTRDATKFAPHCAQGLSQFGHGTTNEDCLYLNVFAPNDDHRGRPVMLWIHGGALVVGESDGFIPGRLVAQGVVVVTVNYRLGALGFLAHPLLSAESPDHVSGNYGIMDQQMAMRWVRENIARFGGNPHNVTVFGESAGGLSTWSNVVSPTAEGLFHRAIVESGSYQLKQPSLHDAETSGAAVITAALSTANLPGCDTSAPTLACIRALPVSRILPVQGGARPNVDGKVLRQSIGDALVSGDFNRVPLINGSNHDEMRLFVPLNFGAPINPVNFQLGYNVNIVPDAQATFTGAIPYSAAVSSRLGIQNAAQIVAQYPSGDTALTATLAWAAADTDAVMSCTARFADAAASRFVPVFAYELNDENAPKNFLGPVHLHDGSVMPWGAYHAGELQYLFDYPFPKLNADQQKLADMMVRYWTEFADSGDPSSRGKRHWRRYHRSLDNIQSLAPGQHGTGPELDFATDHKCAFWDGLAGRVLPAHEDQVED